MFDVAADPHFNMALSINAVPRWLFGFPINIMAIGWLVETTMAMNKPTYGVSVRPGLVVAQLVPELQGIGDELTSLCPIKRLGLSPAMCSGWWF